MNPFHDLKKKTNALQERIEAARQANKTLSEEDRPESPVDSPGARKSARAGSEFMAAVTGGAVLGYGIDWFFSSLPWGMIVFITLGFVTGVYRANEAMKKNYEKNDQ